jgi:hypothetical protein
MSGRGSVSFLCKWFVVCIGVIFTLPSAVSQSPDPGRVAAQCRIRDYGAKGDGIAMDTLAINSAVQDCHSRGGGTVLVEPGTYRTGTINLMDNIELRLDAGATLLGSADNADYSHLAQASENRDTALIVAEHVHNVSVTGEGTIDGNGRAFIVPGAQHFNPYFDPTKTRQGPAIVDRMGARREGPVNMGKRPGVLLLVLHSDGIALRDFHVVDSPNWGVKVMCSDHISVSGLDVRNNMLIPNNDALDVSASRNVNISNSNLEAGDDALVIGGPCADGWCQLPEENVVVSNVILRSRSAALRIGPAAKDVRNITVENAIIRDSNRGISIQSRSGETVENLIFTNIVSDTRLMDGPWWGAGEPISITVGHWAYPPWGAPQSPGIIRHVRFNEMLATSQSPIVLYSNEPGGIEDVEFRAVSLHMQAGPLNSILGGNLDLQPSTPSNLGLVRHDLSALEIHNVQDLNLVGLRVHWTGDFPEYYRHAIHADGFDGLRIDDFRGSGSTPSEAALDFSHGKGLALRDAHATSGPLLGAKSVHSTAMAPSSERSKKN